MKLDESDSFAVTSVGRACDILASWRQPGEILQLREIAARTHLNKATACRILSTLTAKGLVERVGAHGYRSRLRPLESKSFRFGYAAQSSVGPFISTVTEGVIVAANAAGVDLLVVNNNASRKAALRNAERLIREKVDLAIEFQLIWDVASELAARYSQAGVPLIAVDVPHPGAIYFGADNYRAGQIGGRYMGRWIAQRWKGQVDHVVLIGVGVAGPIVESRLNGFFDGMLDLVPQARQAAMFRYDTKATFDQTLDAMRKHLRRHRAAHIAVGAVNDISALAALEAFTEVGLQETCAIVGQGAVVEARTEMRRAGTPLIGSVAYYPEKYGERLVALALDVLNRKPFPPAVFTDHQIVTPSNVDKLYPNDMWMNSSIAAQIPRVSLLEKI